MSKYNSARHESEKHFRLEVEVATRLCRAVDTPRSLMVFLLIKHGEWEQLVDLEIDPSYYQDVGNFADDYLITKFLSKSPNLPLDVDRKLAALSTYLESEKKCRSTNNQKGDLLPLDVEYRIKSVVNSVLPPLRNQKGEYPIVERIWSRMAHGKGSTATLGLRGLVTSDKFDKTISLAPSLIPFAPSIMGETWRRHALHSIGPEGIPNRKPTKLKVVGGSVFGTVPKNAKTDRCTAKPPTLNVFGQLGVGSELKHLLLKRAGVDLSDQSYNRGLASIAHVKGLATIDLKSASDLVSRRVVEELIPSDWLHLLNIFRCERVLMPDGNYLHLEKFSSMGDGYTFELESLIFLAVSRAIVPADEWLHVNIFGDDIIVPQKYAAEVVHTLELLGFECNLKKSCLAGNFFESCGGHYFDGHDVTPFYARGGDDTIPAKSNDVMIPYALQLANALRLWTRRRSDLSRSLHLDARFKDLWLWLLKKIPREWRKCRVPKIFGDTGVISTFSELGPGQYYYPDPVTEAQWEGVYVNQMTFRVQKIRKRSNSVLLAKLAALGRADDPLQDSKRPPTPRDVETSSAMEGQEPRRGLFLRPRPNKTYVLTSAWDEGLSWDQFQQTFIP